MTKIALLDNNDSFTYNLVQLLEQCGADVFVTNDNISILESADAILLSPGPGLPSDYPIMTQVINEYHSKKSILGVCLGHQALASYFGCDLYRIASVKHGIKSQLSNTFGEIYKGISESIFVGRYHSWAVKFNENTELIPTSFSKDDNVIMSFSHKNRNIYGIQYHPESIITSHGKQIIQNWLDTI